MTSFHSIVNRITRNNRNSQKISGANILNLLSPLRFGTAVNQLWRQTLFARYRGQKEGEPRYPSLFPPEVVSVVGFGAGSRLQENDSFGHLLVNYILNAGVLGAKILLGGAVMSDNSKWRGIAIEESFTRATLPPRARKVSTRFGPLGGEESQGPVHLHAITVMEEDLDIVAGWARNNLRSGWYMHLVKGNRMLVIFRGHVFDLIRGDREAIERTRRFGIYSGVHPEQLPLEKLFGDPFA